MLKLVPIKGIIFKSTHAIKSINGDKVETVCGKTGETGLLFDGEIGHMNCTRCTVKLINGESCIR